MFLLDSNVISERKKGQRADPGVIEFFDNADRAFYLPVQVVGELRFGSQILRQRGDLLQAARLENWFQRLLEDYSNRILPFDLECAIVWGALRASNDQNLIDKQIAAIALVFDLTIVTRNTKHFVGTGVRLLNPFFADRQIRHPAT